MRVERDAEIIDGKGYAWCEGNAIAACPMTPFYLTPKLIHTRPWCPALIRISPSPTTTNKTTEIRIVWLR